MIHRAQRLNDELTEALPAWTERDRRLFLHAAETVEYQPGDVMAHEGAPAEEFLFLLAGTAEIARAGASVGTIGRGDHIGAAAVLTRSRYDVTAISGTQSRVLLLGLRQFSGLLSAAPDFGRMLASSFAVQLRAAGAPPACVPVQVQRMRAVLRH